MVHKIQSPINAPTIIYKISSIPIKYPILSELLHGLLKQYANRLPPHDVYFAQYTKFGTVHVDKSAYYRYSPCVIAISCNGISLWVFYCNNVTLKVLLEIIIISAVTDSANASLVIIQRNKIRPISVFTDKLRAFRYKQITSQLFCLFACSDSVRIIGITVSIKLLELS